jgi:predicted DNA-binding transcriptional regulator AlpA
MQQNQNTTLPLLLRAAEAAALCGTSLRTWRMWDAVGRIPVPIRIGHLVFWRPDELKAWAAAGCPDRVTWETLRS